LLQARFDVLGGDIDRRSGEVLLAAGEVVVQRSVRRAGGLQ
jgi:hypothetical protein